MVQKKVLFIVLTMALMTTIVAASNECFNTGCDDFGTNPNASCLDPNKAPLGLFDDHWSVQSGSWKYGAPDGSAAWSNPATEVSDADHSLPYPIDRTDRAYIRNGHTISVNTRLWGSSTSSTNYVRRVYVGYYEPNPGSDDFVSGNGTLRLTSSSNLAYGYGCVETEQFRLGHSEGDNNAAYLGMLRMVHPTTASDGDDTPKGPIFEFGHGYGGNICLIGSNANMTGYLDIRGGLFNADEGHSYLVGWGWSWDWDTSVCFWNFKDNRTPMHLGAEGSTGIVRVGYVKDLEPEPGDSDEGNGAREDNCLDDAGASPRYTDHRGAHVDTHMNGIWMGAEPNDGSGTFTVMGNAEVDANHIIIGEYGDYTFRYMAARTGPEDTTPPIDPNTTSPRVSFQGADFTHKGAMVTGGGTGTATLAWDLFNGDLIKPMEVGRNCNLQTGTSFEFTGGQVGASYTLITLIKDTPTGSLTLAGALNCTTGYVVSKSRDTYDPAGTHAPRTVDQLIVTVATPVAYDNQDLEGDLTGDGVVDVKDYSQLAGDWMDSNIQP